MVVLMIDMDRTLGRWRLRVWGLVVNLIGNGLALFGVVRVMRGGSPWLAVLGIAITVCCFAALSIPSRSGLR